MATNPQTHDAPHTEYGLKVAWSNLKYILMTDLLPIRFALGFASIFWVLWALATTSLTMTYPDVHLDSNIFIIIPLWVWIIVFLCHGTATLVMVLLKIRFRPLRIFVTCIGALLWSYDLDLILLTHISQGYFPLLTAQWTMVGLSWWVFIRTCYGN